MTLTATPDRPRAKSHYRPLTSGEKRRKGDQMRYLKGSWLAVPPDQFGKKITKATLRIADYRRPLRIYTDDERERIAFGDRVRAKRLEAGLSQKELAAKVGLTPAAMNNIETGTSWGSMPVYGRICETLGIVPALMK